PVPVPGVLFDRRDEGMGPGFQLVSAGIQPPQPAQRSAAPQRRDAEPGEPHALTAAISSYTVESVVPVTRTDERQAAWARTGGVVEGTEPVLQQGGGQATGSELCVALVFACCQLRALEERNLLVQHPLVAQRLHVDRGDVRQPHEVVRDPGAHATRRRRVPPVQHVALWELVRGRLEQLGTRQLRRGVQQGKRVLELVAETDGAA